MYLLGSKVTFTEEYAQQFCAYKKGHTFTVVQLPRNHGLRKHELGNFRAIDGGDDVVLIAYVGALEEATPTITRQRVRRKAEETVPVLPRRRLRR